MIKLLVLRYFYVFILFLFIFRLYLFCLSVFFCVYCYLDFLIVSKFLTVC